MLPLPIMPWPHCTSATRPSPSPPWTSDLGPPDPHTSGLGPPSPDTLVVTSNGQHWRPAQTCSFEDRHKQHIKAGTLGSMMSLPVWLPGPMFLLMGSAFRGSASRGGATFFCYGLLVLAF